MSEVSHDEIVAVLRPIWRETPVVARRLLQRISIVFDMASGSINGPEADTQRGR